MEDYENSEGIFLDYNRVMDVTQDQNYNLAPRK